MSIILNILETIAAEPSKNAKIEILKGVKNSKNNELFQKAMIATFHPTTEYYIKKFNTTPDHGHFGSATLDYAIDQLHVLSNREVTGNAAKVWLDNALGQLSEDDAEVLARIIKRDLRAGFTESTVNKVWPNLIYSHPYMRGSGFSDKLLKKQKFPCYTQLKSDGLYSDTVVRADSVTYMARSGKIQELNNPKRDAALMAAVAQFGEFVLQGEVLVNDENGVLMERSASNGYMNKDDKDLDRIFISAWDMIPLSDWGPKGKCTVPYSERFANVEALLTTGIPGLELTEHRVCNSVDDIVAHFTEVRERGEEGIMLKNPNMIWKDGTSTEMIKLKVVIEVELKVIGWKEGTGKYVGQVGSIACRSECGDVEVSFGSGMSDAERKSFVAKMEDWIANEQVVTVKCNGVTLSKVEGAKYSLFLPRLKEIRTDKSVADDLQKIQEQEASFTDALALIEG